MPHCLFLGITESGKTTLAKQLVVASKKNTGSCSIVLDPMSDPGWQADFKTKDADEFLAMVWDSQRCDVIVDEAGDAIGRYDTVMEKVATQGRHWGHNAYFLCQRGAQLSATVRAQCRHLFLFTSAKDDCKILANEFNQPVLLEANTLPQGHFIHVTRFGHAMRGKLW